MSELFTLGFCFQTFMVIMATSIFNPAAVGALGGEDLATEIASFLRWCVPLGFFGIIVYRVLMLMSTG